MLEDEPMCAVPSWRVLLFSAALVMRAAAAHAQPASTDGSLLRISFIDVGQGDAIWIHGPDDEDGSPGGDLIIDGGPDRGDGNRLLKYLKNPSYGLKPGSSIDCIVVSHPHTDHYPGLMDVLADYDVRKIVDSGFPKSPTTPSGKPSEFAKFREAALKERADGKKSSFVELGKTPTKTLNCGNIQVGVIRAFSPKDKDMGSKVNTRENNASIVLKLTFGRFSFLFMGDAEGQDRHQDGKIARFVEQLLLSQASSDLTVLKATVLKVGHHGSDTGSTLPFIQAVNPDVIVVMSGRKDFGKVDAPVFLPDRVVLDRYRQINPNVAILRTDDNDAVEHRTEVTDADGDDVYMYTDGETLRAYRAARVPGGTTRKWKLAKTIKATP